VATNTTVYKETDMTEIEQMFAFLSSLGVDGHTISPGYEYDAAKKDMVSRLNLQPEDFFLTRKMDHPEIREDHGLGQPVSPSSGRRCISSSSPASGTSVAPRGRYQRAMSVAGRDRAT